MRNFAFSAAATRVFVEDLRMDFVQESTPVMSNDDQSARSTQVL